MLGSSVPSPTVAPTHVNENFANIDTRYRPPVADVGDLGWYNMINASDIISAVIKKKISWFKLIGLEGDEMEPLENYGETYVPPNSVAGDPKDVVDVKCPP